jgi:hypothetical protein
MERMVLAGIFALATSTTLAQTGPSPDPVRATGPANICRELLAFIETPATANAASAKPAAAGAATGTDKMATAKQQAPAPAPGQAAAPQPGAGNSSSQQQTAQSGPATDAPTQESATTKESSAQNAPQRGSVSAPVTNDPASTPKESVLSVAEARELANAGDLAACQATARELRIAGVAVPGPLLALTALDLQYHTATTEQRP